MTKQFRLGAAIAPKHKQPRIMGIDWAAPGPPEPKHPDAYALAMANKHKPWARRWLRMTGRR